MNLMIAAFEREKVTFKCNYLTAIKKLVTPRKIPFLIFPFNWFHFLYFLIREGWAIKRSTKFQDKEKPFY
jgi:hypothetical protein